MGTYEYTVTFMYKGKQQMILISSYKDLMKETEWQEDAAQSAITWFFKNNQEEEGEPSSVTNIALFREQLLFHADSLKQKPIDYNCKEDGEIEPIFTYSNYTIK